MDLVCTWFNHALWLPCTLSLRLINALAPIGGTLMNESNIHMLCRFPAKCLLMLHQSKLTVISVIGPISWQWCALSIACRILTSSPIINFVWNALFTLPLWINPLFSWRGISFVGYHFIVGTLPRMSIRFAMSWFVKLPIPPSFRSCILVILMLHMFWLLPNFGHSCVYTFALGVQDA
jgi:hypothetical protein